MLDIIFKKKTKKQILVYEQQILSDGEKLRDILIGVFILEGKKYLYFQEERIALNFKQIKKIYEFYKSLEKGE